MTTFTWKLANLEREPATGKVYTVHYAIDASKIERELGWKPSVTFEEGLARTVDWYLNNPEWLANVTSGAYQQYYEKQYLR